jgi:membrane fusion protein (multidrug efflux system)
MSSPFAHTLRSLEVDGARGARALALLAVLLLGAWSAWLLIARIPVTEVSDDARVQVDAAGHELAVAIAGRVLAVRVGVGEQVEAGEVVVELDDRDTQLALGLAREHADSLATVVEQRRREIAAEREAIEAVELASGAALAEARARVDQALAAARLAETELAEIVALRESEIGTVSELRRSEATAAQRQAITRELKSASTRERFEQDREVRDRLATIIRIEAIIASLEVELAGARGTVETLIAELEHHRVRAPIDGVIGELDSIERGSWLDRGEVVGVVVPTGELEIVAQFDPSAAIGRIAVGQTATLRLAGFPWTQYGSIRARVARVSSELREGTVRVELDIISVPPAIILEHALPGSLEVEVEQASPASLLLRAAGRRLTGTGAGEASSP